MVISGLPADVAADVLGEIRELLFTQDIDPTLVETILHEPEVQDVDRVAKELHGNGAGRGCFLLAIGGGAAIDLAKAAAVVATNRQSPTVADDLEGVGRGLKIVDPPLPVLAMPTTAGTGAEATRNAVISSYDPPFKKSLRDDRILPRIALVDPELTVPRSPEVTAASGMDAIHNSSRATSRERPSRFPGAGNARARRPCRRLPRRWRTAAREPRGSGCRMPPCFRAWRWPTRG